MLSAIKSKMNNWYQRGEDEADAYAISLITSLKDNGTLLDLGCGDCFQGNKYHKYIRTSKTIHIDLKDQNLFEEKNYVREWDLNIGIPIDIEPVDFILCREVIEHMLNPDYFLQECYRVLKPSGQFLLITENLASWGNTLALVLGWQPFSLTTIGSVAVGNPLVWHQQLSHHHYDNGHLHIMTYRALVELVRLVGFRNIKSSTIGLKFLGFRGHFIVIKGEK